MRLGLGVLAKDKIGRSEGSVMDRKTTAMASY